MGEEGLFTLTQIHLLSPQDIIMKVESGRRDVYIKTQILPPPPPHPPRWLSLIILFPFSNLLKMLSSGVSDIKLETGKVCSPPERALIFPTRLSFLSGWKTTKFPLNSR
jgi:hypothetical protein